MESWLGALLAADLTITTRTIFTTGFTNQALPADPAALARLAFLLTISNPVEDIVTTPLLLFVLSPLFCLWPLLLLTLGTFTLLLITGSLFLLFPFALNTRSLQTITINFYPVILALIPVNPGPVIIEPITILMTRKATGITLKIPGAVRVLAIFPGNGLIAVGNAPPMPGRVAPVTGPCDPMVMSDKSWSLAHIDVNRVEVPIKIAPVAEGETKIYARPV